MKIIGLAGWSGALHRTANGKPHLFSTPSDVRGLITDGPRPSDWSGPIANIDDVAGAADQLLRSAAHLAKAPPRLVCDDLPSPARQAG